MDPLLKIALGAFLGFVLGLLAEPIKFSLASQLKRRHARRLIYEEVARLIAGLQFVSERWHERDDTADSSDIRDADVAAVKRILEDDLFQFYYDKDKPLYYEMDDVSELNGCYHYLREQLTTATPSTDEFVVESFILNAAANAFILSRHHVWDDRLLAKLIEQHKHRLSSRSMLAVRESSLHPKTSSSRAADVQTSGEDDE
jgi:hypothetical protein